MENLYETQLTIENAYFTYGIMFMLIFQNDTRLHCTWNDECE